MFDGYLMACNYYPKGNVENEPVFIKGPICSKCSPERSFCSKTFLALCGHGNFINFSLFFNSVFKINFDLFMLQMIQGLKGQLMLIQNH